MRSRCAHTALALLLSSQHAAALRFEQGFSVQEINEDEFAALDAIRILNDDDLVPDQPVDLLVKCQHGSLSINSATRQSLNETSFTPEEGAVSAPYRTIRAQTTVHEAQWILQALEYAPDPDYHGNWGSRGSVLRCHTTLGNEVISAWLEISKLTTIDTCSASEQATCSAQSDAESFPSTGACFHERRLSVKAMNDTPTITLLSTEPLRVDNGSCVLLSEMVLDDVDELAMQRSSELPPMMTVQLKTTIGSLQLNQRTALEYSVRIRDKPMNTHQPVLLFANAAAVLDGSLSDLNAYISTIQYCAFVGQNGSVIKPPLARNDALVIELSDNGVCGEVDSTPLSTTATLPIEILPVIDLGQISPSEDPVTLVNHSAPLNLQYLSGTVDQLGVDLQFEHNDGTLIGIDGQFVPLVVGPASSTTGYVQTVTRSDFAGYDDHESEVLHLATAFQKEVQLLEARLDADQTFEEAAVELSFTFAGTTSSFAMDLLPSASSATSLQSAMKALTNAGWVTVSGGVWTAANQVSWTITFESLTGSSIPLLAVNVLSFPGVWSGVGAPVRVTRLQAGSINPQIGEITISADNTLTTGEFALRIVNPPELRAVVSKIPFDVTAADLQDLLTSETRLDQVSVSEAVNADGQLTWQITFLTDTFIAQHRKISILPAWYNAQRPFGPQHCAACAAFSSGSSDVDQVQYKSVDPGSIGLDGSFQLKFDGLVTVDISVHDSQSFIASKLMEALTYRIATQLSITVLNCQDSQLACSWKVSYPSAFASSESHFEINNGAIIGSGLTIDTTIVATGLQTQIYLSSSHRSWVAPRSVSMPYQFTQDLLRDTISLLTGLNTTVRCRTLKQQMCTIEYQSELTTIPAVYLSDSNLFPAVEISSLQPAPGLRYQDHDDCGLVIWTSANTDTFKLSRSVCRLVDDCRLLQSPALSFGSANEMVIQSAKGLALDGELTDQVNVLRFSLSGNYLHIANLPRSFVLDVQVLTQTEATAWQALCPKFNLQGDADQVALGLKNTTLYSLGGPRRINRLGISVHSEQDETSDAAISTAVNVDIRANYEQINFKMPRDIVLDNGYVKWLSSVSISDSSDRWIDPKYDCDECRVPTRALWLSIEAELAQVRVGVHPTAVATRVRSFGRALDLRGQSLSNLNEAMKAVYIDAKQLLREPSKLSLYIKNQTFHVRVMAQKTMSVQVLSTSTSVADGAVGSVQLTLTLPTGYYGILKARASRVICNSVPIDVTDTTDVIANQIATMPCSPSFDPSMLFRREIQTIRVEALDPFTIDGLSGSFKLEFNGQTTNAIPIGSSSTTLKQMLSGIIADPAIEVTSLTLTGENAFVWLVTFGETKDQQDQLQAIVSSYGMPSFSVTTDVVQQGFGASDIQLNRLIPGLAVSIRALTAQESPSYALEFSFLNVSRDFPMLVVTDNSLLSATTNEALDVEVFSANQERSANDDFQLRINQRTTALIAANSSGLELERAILDLEMIHLDLSVQRHALNDGDNLFEWIIVASYPTSLNIATLRTKPQEQSSVRYEVSCESHGTEILTAFDTVRFSFSLSDANTTLANGSVAVRVEKKIERGATVDFGFSYLAVRLNESVAFGDMVLRGMERNVTLVISASQGLVSLIPRSRMNSLLPIRAPQSMVILEGSAVELNDALQFQQLIYSPYPDAFGFDRVMFALNWRDGERNTSIPIKIIASVVAPALQLPAKTIRVFQDEEIDIPQLKLLERVLTSTAEDLSYFAPEVKIVRVQIQSMSNGVLALNQAMQRFLGYADKQRQWKNTLELSGSIDQVNLALTGVRYNASTLDNDMDFDWLQFTTYAMDNSAWSIPKVYRLNVSILARPVEVQILMNGQVISDPFELTTAEDSAISLRNISIRVKNSVIDPSNMLNASLFATHGTLVVNNGATETALPTDEDAAICSIAGTLNEVNIALRLLFYMPNPNFHGTDRIVLKILQNPTSESIDQLLPEATAVFPVFVTPVFDTPQLLWASSRSNTTFLSVSTTAPVALPDLLIMDGEQESDGNFYIMKLLYQAVLEADSGTLTHDVVTSQITALRRSRLTFIGTLQDLSAMITSTKFKAAPTVGFASSINANVSVQVSLVDFPNAMAVVSDLVSSALLRIDLSGLERLPLLKFLWHSISTDEESEVHLGGAFDWRDQEVFSFQPYEFTLDISAINGSLYQIEDEHKNSLPLKKTHHVDVEGISQLESILSRLYYVPDTDFYGHDKIQIIAAKQTYYLSVRVLPVNDAPQIQIQNETHSSSEYGKIPTKTVLPGLQVSDSDGEKRLELELRTVNCSLIIDLVDPCWNGIYVTRASESVLVFSSSPQLLNAALNDPVLKLIPTAISSNAMTTPAIQACSVEFCVNDGELSTCETRIYTLGMPLQLFSKNSNRSEVSRNHAINLSSLFDFNDEFYYESDIIAHVSVSVGYFTIEDFACANLQEIYGRSEQDPAMELILAGSVECITAAFSSAMYHANPVSDDASDTVVLTAFDEERRLLGNESILIHVAARQSPYQFLEEDSLAANSTEWWLTRSEHRRLSSFTAVTINATEPEDDEGDDETFMTLNISCSSCLISYPVRFIPGLSYQFARPSSRTQLFSGSVNSLNEMLRQLELSIDTTESLGELKVTLLLSFDPALSLNYRSWFSWNETLEITIPYKLIPVPLSLDLSQSEFVASLKLNSPVRPLHAVKISGGDESLKRVLHVRLECAGDHGLVSVENTQVSRLNQVVNRRCGPGQTAIEFTTTRKNVNLALASIAITPNRTSASGKMNVSYSAAWIDDKESAQAVTLTILSYPEKARSRIALNQSDLIVHINEDESSRIGRWLTLNPEVQDDDNLLEVTTEVDHGSLFLPDAICCVSINELARGFRIVGPPVALLDALLLLEYTGDSNYAGADEWKLVIKEYQIEANERSMDPYELAVPLTIAPVNDPPEIHHIRRLISRNSTPGSYLRETFQISDVDLANLQVVGGDSATTTFQVNITAIIGSLLLQEDALERVHVLNAKRDSSGYSSISFEALLEDSNRLLATVLYQPNESFLCSENLKDFEISVSDRAHGVKTWIEQETSLKLQLFGCNIRLRDPVLVLPPENVYLNEAEMKLTIFGLELIDEDLQFNSRVGQSVNEANSMVSVVGACGFSVEFEIQRVHLMPPDLYQIMTLTVSSTAGSSTLSGSFELQVDLSFAGIDQVETTSVYANAVATVVDELLGEQHNGKGPSESIEAALLALYGSLSPTLRFHVLKSVTSMGNSWTIYVMGYSGMLAIPTIATSSAALTAQGLSALMVQSAQSAPVGGIFQLQLGDETSPSIPYDASAFELQNALESLSTVQTVRVTKPAVNTWEITYFSPGERIPLAQGVANALLPQATESDAALSSILANATSIETERISYGKGQGNLFEITIGATRFDPVYLFTTSAASRITGGFSLGFQNPDNILGPLLSVSDTISFDAVAMRSDESVAQNLGGRFGESMQTKLETAIRALPGRYFAQVSSSVVSVSVTRTTPDAMGGVSWIITIRNAPLGFPALVVSSSALAGSQAKLTLSETQSPNPVGGTFTISYGSHQTDPIAADADAQTIEVALNQLSSVQNRVFRYGRVAVRKSLRYGPRDLYSYAVLFAQDIATMDSSEIRHERLIVDSSSLTGVGAFARVDVLQERTASGSFSAMNSVMSGGESDSWTAGVLAQFRGDWFRFQGFSDDLEYWLQYLSYQLPSNWYGSVTALVALSSALDSDMNWSSSLFNPLSIVQSTLVPIPFRNPTVDIQVKEVSPIQVVRALPIALQLFDLRVADFAVTRWANARVSCNSGSIYPKFGGFSSVLPSTSLWLNGTIASINSQLKEAMYVNAMEVPAFDKLTLEIFINGTQVGMNFTMIHIQESAIVPLLHIDGSLEGPFTTESWGIVTRKLTYGDDLVVSGVSIVDSTGSKSRMGEILVLTVSAELGMLSFSPLDQLTTTKSSSAKEVTVVGEMDLLNDALRVLHYKCSGTYNERDSITLLIRSNSSEITQPHKRTIQLQIAPLVEIPRIYLSSTTYHGQEDTTFQFPDLALHFPSAKSTNSTPSRGISRSNGFISQLWATELTIPTTKYSYPRTTFDDRRHRWVFDLPPLKNASQCRSFCASGNLFFFVGSDSQHGDELWVSDGSTPGTHMLIDLWPGSGSSSPSGMTLFNGIVYFAALGLDLSWMLGGNSCNSMRNSSVHSDLLYVVAASNVWDPAKTYECPVGFHWATTKEISSYFPPTGQTDSINLNEPYVFWNTCQWSGYVFGSLSRKYFRFADSQTTGALKHAGRRESAPVEVSFTTTEFAGVVCIKDQGPIKTAGLGRELWRTDGTTSGTSRVLDLRVGPQGSNPRTFTSFQSQWLVFQATTEEFGTELYKTDGTAIGTIQIEDIWRGPRSSSPDGFVEWTAGDGRMYFAATTDNGRELWATDGFSSFSLSERGHKATKTATSPAVGTVAVSDICSGAQSSNPVFLTPTSSGIFFSADDCVHGRELWVTDGTPTGTRMVKDLATQAGVGSDPSYLVLYGAKIYFQAKADIAIGRELYVSDGTAAGTVLLVDLSPGSPSASPSFLTVMTPRNSAGVIISTDLYFYALDANGRGNMWKSDGTQSGTVPVLDDVFAQNSQRAWRASDYTLSDSRHRLFAFKNAIYYPLDVVTNLANDQVSGLSDTHFSLQVQVNVGHIGIARVNATNQSDIFSSTILLNDTYTGLKDMLSRLTFYPPHNWNSQLTVEAPVVEWVFAIGLEGQAFSFETYADLLLAAKPDAPVISVPYFDEDPAHFTGDLLTRLRLHCLPITCYEDIVQDLSGFSVRASDSPLQQDSFALLTVDISVSHGVLLLNEIASGCITQISGSQTSGHKLFQADTSCVNSILQSWKYLSDPNFSGSDRLQIIVTNAQNLTDLAIVPIIVTEMNDAPFFRPLLSVYEADEDIPLVVQDFQVVDPDIPANDNLVVTINVASGSVEFLHAEAITLTQGATPDDPQWTLVGHLHDMNVALASVVYTSAENWNSLASTISTDEAFDAITLRVSDGNAVNGSTVLVVHVFVNPVPDPILIALAENIPTTIFADASLGLLHGDEDSWIDVYGLSVSSVDDISRMSLQMTLQVTHGILEISWLAGISFVDVEIDASLSRTRSGSTLTFKGAFDHVNETLSSLRYRPNLNFYGEDRLLVTASAVDEYTLQETADASATIEIRIDAVNDPPVWSNGFGSTEGLPVKGASGVTFHDVDIETLDCSAVSCIMELIIETRNGFVVLPSLAEELQAGRVEFATELTDLGSTYVVLSGVPNDLNRVLGQMIFQLDRTEYHNPNDLTRQNIEVSLTIDDRGTFGKGGPLVQSTRVLFTSVDWPTQPLIWNVPIDVLALDEDTAYQFNSELKVDNPDAPQAFPSMLEVTIHCTNGTFALASTTTGLQILQNDSSRVDFRGFLTDINAAFNGSSYIPSTDWFGSETITFAVTDLGSASHSRSAAATVFLYVAPVCDAPKWRSSLPNSAKFSIQEDSRLLIDDLSLTTPDLDDEQHHVTMNITALHGGIMLATWRGLLVWETQYTDLMAQISDPFQSHEHSLLDSRLFFARISVTGSVQDVNAALRGMIYKPTADYNTNGHEINELFLTAQASCADGALPPANYTVRMAIQAVNDPPMLLSPSFVQISTDESILHSELQRSVENALQATEHASLVLDDLSVEDVDRFAVHLALSLPMAVNISCIGCSITLSQPLADLRRQFGYVFFPVSSDQVNTQFIVHGTVASLNAGLMDKLVFQSAKDQDGLSFVVIKLSDLGNFGAGGVQQTAFALAVSVDRAIDRPQVFTAPYGAREPVLRIDENSSVLITGAPSLAELPTNVLTTERSQRVWSLMRAQPFGLDSDQRLNSLSDFAGAESLTTGFYSTLNGKLLFRGKTAGLGSELWKSDGTQAGTRVLKDLYPGPKGSDPSFLTPPFSVDGRVYFSASGLDLSWQIPIDHRDSCQSFRPSAFDARVYYAVSEANVWDPEKTYDCPVGFRWMTTAEATGVFIGSIPTDGHESEPLVYFDQCGWSGYVWGGVDRMYFRFADSETTGSYKHAGYRESYRLDTGFQTDLFAGIVCVRDESIERKPWGPELWATDGTSEGTTRVRRINSLPDGSKPAYFAEMNQRLFFQATCSDFGAELWATDGSQGGTYLVADVEPGTRSSEPRYTTVLVSLLYFSAFTESFGREPWVSDGLQRTDFALDHSTIGTRVLLDICSGTGSSNPQYFTALDASALILFQANDCVHGPELWRTDGTSAGTYLLKDIRAGALGSTPSYLTQFSSRVYFQANDGILGAELWVSDGTSAGTVMLVDLATGAISGRPSFLTVLTLGLATSLVFSAQDERDQKSEFWESDGTFAGTTKLFPNSREIVEINREAMDAMPLARFQALASPAQSFLYLGRKQTTQERKRAAQLQDETSAALLLRSVTLDADVNASDTSAVLTLTLNCSEGSLSIGRSSCPFLTFGRGNATSQFAVLEMNGTLDALNCAMEKLSYHSSGQTRDVRDMIWITLVDNRLQSTMDQDDPMRFTTTKSIPVDIRAVNNAPVIDMLTAYVVSLNQWITLGSVDVTDVDAGEGLLFLQLSVHSGRLRAPQTVAGVVFLEYSDPVNGDSAMEFTGTIASVNAQLAMVQYACFTLDGCEVITRDYLTIHVDDNGFTGAGGPQVASQSATISMRLEL